MDSGAGRVVGLELLPITVPSGARQTLGHPVRAVEHLVTDALVRFIPDAAPAGPPLLAPGAP